MKNNEQIQAQARRIHDHYKRVADEMISKANKVDYYDMAFIRRVSEVQKRKAFCGHILGIGIY